MSPERKKSEEMETRKVKGNMKKNVKERKKEKYKVKEIKNKKNKKEEKHKSSTTRGKTLSFKKATVWIDEDIPGILEKGEYYCSANDGELTIEGKKEKITKPRKPADPETQKKNADKNRARNERIAKKALKKVSTIYGKVKITYILNVVPNLY